MTQKNSQLSRTRQSSNEQPSKEQPSKRLTSTKKALLEKWKKGQSERSQIPECSRLKPLPLSFSQQRLWFVDQYYKGSPFYNIPGALYFKGPLKLKALQQSLNEILRRHQAWRTTFSLADGQPVQVIAPALTWELPITNIQTTADWKTADWDSTVQRLATEEAQKPFNLEQGPLVRAKLVKISETEHVFLLTMHHAVSDGWSIGLFLRELSLLYPAFVMGQPSPLPPLSRQYADFAVWQREQMQGERLGTQLNYWRSQLAGDLPHLQLPTDYPLATQSNATQTQPNASQSSFKGARHYFSFPASLTKALTALSKQEDATLFMTLLAAFKALLHRYTAQTDIVMGTSIANRSRAELETILGCFVNTLVLRTDLEGNPSFRELLSRVRQVTLGAYAHQDLPFEKLVEVLQPDRALGRNPLFQIMFVLQNSPVAVQAMPDLTWKPLNIQGGTAMFDLFFSMFESPDGLNGFVEYSTELFQESTIARLMENFQTLLSSVVEKPESSLAELSLLTPAQRQRILVDWNQTNKKDLDRSASDETDITRQPLHTQFERQVKETPDAIALSILSSPKASSITYQQLNQKANKLAHYLRTLDVSIGTVVAICLDRSIDAVVSILAVLKAGGAYVPIDPSYPQERLDFMLADSQAAVLITQPSFLPQFSEVAETSVVCLNRDRALIKKRSSKNPKTALTLDSLAYVIYTSGSTGTPKGVLGAHRGIVTGLQWYQSTYPLEQGDVCCQKTALSFIDSVWEIFAPLVQGNSTIIIPDPLVKDPQQFLTALADQQIARVVLVPSLLQLLLEFYERNQQVAKPKQLPKLWIASGEELSVELVKRFKAQLPNARLINLYGSSEVAANVTHYDTAQLPESALRVPLGNPIDNSQVYCLDDHLEPTPVGIIGELYVGGDSLSQGYLNQVDLTQARFIDNPFTPGTKLYKTGDTACYLDNGQLDYRGRQDQQIKLRGIRIELQEIEHTINQHSAVQRSVVVPEVASQSLVAFVVTLSGQALPATELQSFLKAKLPAHLIPARFMSLEALPLTPNGKTDRRSLNALITDGSATPLPRNDQTPLTANSAPVAPRNAWEIALTQIWEDLLQVKPIGITDNFFDLGGHSFLAVRLMAKVHEQFGQQLPLSALFEAATIEQLTQKIRQQMGSGSQSSLVTIQSAGEQLPFYCMHPAGGNIIAYPNLAHHLGSHYPFYALEHTPKSENPAVISVEQTAANYIDEIRQIQPEGPYRIGGWCYGGVLAFEMAQQLRQQGHSIESLVIIDAILPDRTQPVDEDDDARFILRISQSIQYLFGIEAALDYAELQPLTLNEQFKLLMERANILGHAEIQQHLGAYKLFKAHVQALRDYEPKPYAGKITLLRATEQLTYEFETTEFMTSDPWLGWKPYATQPIDRLDVPGNHFSMFADPHAQALGKLLKGIFDPLHAAK